MKVCDFFRFELTANKYQRWRSAQFPQLNTYPQSTCKFIGDHSNANSLLNLVLTEMKILDTEVPEANWKEMLRAKRITGFVSPGPAAMARDGRPALVPDNPDLMLTIIDHCVIII